MMAGVSSADAGGDWSASSSDSDSDDGLRMERRAAKRARRGGLPVSQSSEEGPAAPPTSPVPPAAPHRPSAPGPKHNSIWSDVLSEQSLTSGLSAGQVADAKDLVRRDVESFPLPAHLLGKPRPKPHSSAFHHRKHQPHKPPPSAAKAKGPAKPAEKEDGEAEDSDAEMEEGEAPAEEPTELFGDDHSEANEHLGPGATKRQGKRSRVRGGQWKRDGSSKERKGGSKERKKKEAPVPVPDVELDPGLNPVLLAGRMAEALGEPKVELIEKVLEEIGPEKAIQVFGRTRETQAAGGLMTLNKGRLRTPGGVFLFLVREDGAVPAPAKHRLFVEEKGRQRKIAKVKRSLNDPNKSFEQILAETRQALQAGKDKADKADGATDSAQPGPQPTEAKEEIMDDADSAPTPSPNTNIAAD